MITLSELAINELVEKVAYQIMNLEHWLIRPDTVKRIKIKILDDDVETTIYVSGRYWSTGIEKITTNFYSPELIQLVNWIIEQNAAGILIIVEHRQKRPKIYAKLLRGDPYA